MYFHPTHYSKFCDLIFVLFLVTFQHSLTAQIAPNSQFATFSGGIAGNGTFNCSETPDFTYSIAGTIGLGETSVPGANQSVDNNGGGMETTYGQADGAENIEIEVAAYFGSAGDVIANTVITTIDFNSPITAGELAFIIADIEQDQVIICALDPNGNPVPVSVINSWFKSAFDANNSDNATLAPSWDAATATLVGQEAIGGVKQTVYQNSLPDNESGAAWFETTVDISQLQFKSQALGIAPDDPSMHFILASKCTDPAAVVETAIPTMGEWGLICLTILIMIVSIAAIRHSVGLKETALIN